MDKLIELETNEAVALAMQKQNSFFVFSTSWCPDCHYMKTYIGEIVDENPEYTFYYIDRDKLTDLCIELNILGIPSFVVFNEGTEKGRFVSKLRKTKAEVQDFINSLKEA